MSREIEWANGIAKKIEDKLSIVAKRNEHKIPYTTKNGVFNDCTDNICWWTNGFWGGMMWQLYHATKLMMYKTIAIENEIKLDKNLMNHLGMDHDSGFKWLPTAVAHYRLTGDEESKNRGLLAADNLAGRYNLNGKFIRAWNDNGSADRAGWAIIDCMMNLPLLYWAYEETKDPRYLQIALSHANTARQYFVREDGSVNHIVEFQPDTGAFIRTYGGQGYAVGSTWTRGQAWAIYGFVLSYLHTKRQEYIQTARKCADYFITHTPESAIIPVDFCQPKDCTYEDSTAAVIAACGFLELAKIDDCQEKSVYYQTALRLLNTIAEKRCNWSFACDNIVEKCTAAYHDQEHEFSIIYGDYFFIEAIWKLTGKELFVW